MAKSAILNVLEDTIGRYVLGLDAKSLNVAVWAGKIELNSLQVDVDAVNRELKRKALEAPNLALPFRVVSGSFDSLQVDVPWARITSKPVVLRAKGLTATIEPYDHLSGNFATRNRDEKPKRRGKKKKKGNSSDFYSADELEDDLDNVKPADSKKIDERMHTLDLAEETRQRINAIKRLGDDFDEDEDLMMQSNDADQTRNTSSAGFKARLVRRVIENLQLEIDDIHFQLKGQGCDIGASLERFSIFTTDEKGKKTFIDRATTSKNIKKSFLYKALELQGLAVYCNEAHSLVPGYLKQTYKPMDEDRLSKTYILSPLSFSARLRQSDCIQCIDFPKYLLSANLPNVSFRMTRMQLELLNRIAQDIYEKQHVARPLFPEYRPDDGPITRKNAKAWWKYAVRSIGRISRRNSWKEFYIAYRKRKVYVDLYKRLIFCQDCSWLKPLTISDRAALDQLEHDKSISTQGIMAWRNMAEAQAELEMKKYDDHIEAKRIAQTTARSATKKKTTFRSMLFGKKESEEDTLDHDGYDDDNDDPPISLSVAEMRELDSLALENASAEVSLSSDSILCDVSFELGSFHVDLVTFASAPLMSLEMGTVMATFKANADGSLKSAFSLSSLNVYDRITANSLFPLVIRSLQSSNTNASFETFKNAIEIKFSKSQNGDQSLEAKMVSYEIVACDILITELKRFVTFGAEKELKNVIKSKPMLEFSMTGGADLFYDADSQMESTAIMPREILQDIDDFATTLGKNNPTPKKSIVRDKFSSAFAEAWKSKTEKESVWNVQLELHAPILVLPQNCTDPLSTTLVVDLGTFTMTYGKILMPEVKDWFSRASTQSIEDMVIDQCNLEMEHFSLSLSKAGKKDWLDNRSTQVSKQLDSIIDPVTLNLSIGFEPKGLQRKCIFGTLEQIYVTISHNQIMKTVDLFTSWQKVLETLSKQKGPSEGITILDEESEHDDEEKVGKLATFQEQRMQTLKSSMLKTTVFDELHVSVTLKEIKAKVVNERGEYIEAHLILAAASMTKSSDQASRLNLQMGHFWILDHLGGDFPREQRLVVHSHLPLSPAEYAARSFNVIDTFKGAKDSAVRLADIKITSYPQGQSGSMVDDPFGIQGKRVPTTIIDAKFSTLYIHWNPYAIRKILDFKDNLFSLLDNIRSVSKKPTYKRTSIYSKITEVSEQSSLVLNAHMEAFEVYLNSAKDDMPLFGMNMSNASVNLHLVKGSSENMLVSAALGDFRLEVLPSIDFINHDYLTILGLSPNHSSSLLQLQYGKGPLALKCCAIENFNCDENEMFVIVNLSPMRFVHLHAVVFTMIEYLTEGILGAIAEKVAETAVQAAREMAQAETSKNKIFNIHAQGFDFVLPQEPHSEDYFVLKASDLDVDFISLPRPGEGQAYVRLHDVTMSSSDGDALIENPISLNVECFLAPLDSSDEDAMATRISICMTKVGMFMARHHYAQVMKTLDGNISEVDTFLRDENQMQRIVTTAGDKADVRLTHGGVEEVVVKKRMYMSFHFSSLCFHLCGENASDFIASVTAVESEISMKLQPDTDETIVDATLKDLVIEDTRFVGVGREFRKLIHQVNDEGGVEEVFSVKYCKKKLTNDTKIEMSFGSPRIVFIPDLVSDVLAYFKTEEPSLPPTAIEIKPKQAALRNISSHGSLADEALDKKSLDFKLKTEDCSFVLIDMGSSIELQRQKDNSSYVPVETLVMKGQTSISTKMVSEVSSGEILDLEAEVHGDDFEIFSAQGASLIDPIQILSPTKVTFFCATKSKEDHQLTELNFVTLADTNAIISMQQYALFQAISTSIKDNLPQSTDSNSMNKPLTAIETNEIENLAKALDYKEGDETNGVTRSVSRQSTTISQTSTGGMKKRKDRVIKLKVTIPKTTVAVVNDLQGVDEALFKVTLSSFLNNTEVCLPEKKEDIIFHSHTYLLLDADYFNIFSNAWEPLLLKSWELDSKLARGAKKNTKRKATTVDIESHPCEISFSEQFIISLKSASAMWTTFSGVNDKAHALIEKMSQEEFVDERNLSRLKSVANCAARSLKTMTSKYAIVNHTGLSITYITDQRTVSIQDSEMHFFNFPLQDGEGSGGYRLYGQDVISQKNLALIVDDHQIVFPHIDDELKKGKRVHFIDEERFVFTEVRKHGKALVLHIHSFMDIYNETCLDFTTSLRVNGDICNLGSLSGDSSFEQHSQMYRNPKLSQTLGVNADILTYAYGSSSNNRVWLRLRPTQYNDLEGELELPPLAAFRKMGEKESSKIVEVICSPPQGQSGHSITLRLECRVTLVKNCPSVELFLRPRLLLKNELFVKALIATPMQGTLSKSYTVNEDQGTWVHNVKPFEVVEVFHAGASIACAFRCADNPIGGNKTGWNKFGWIDIPISLNSQLKQNINSSFPFLTANGKPNAQLTGGCDFYLADAVTESKNDTIRNEARCVTLSVNNLGVDHTGDILFESWGINKQVSGSSQNFMYSSFSSSLHKRRITILPVDENYIRVVHLSMDGIDGFRRSKEFCIEDIAYCEGGIESTPVLWEDETVSGYYAYRKMTLSRQTELHIIPEFVVFNGGEYKARVTVQRSHDSVIESNKMAIVKRASGMDGLVISVAFDEFNCASAAIQVDQVGLKVVLLRALDSGSPVGSLAIQTVFGTKDSRFVIKLGALKHGNVINKKAKSLIHRDFLHYRIRWSALEITLLDSSKPVEGNAIQGNALRHVLASEYRNSYESVSTFALERFTLDYQKLFKEQEKVDCARSQFSAIIHNIEVLDCTKNTQSTMLSSIGENHNFLDMRLRTRGSGDAGLAKIDLLEVKIAHCEKKANPVVIKTSEDFLWNLIDIASRTNNAISEISSVETFVTFDRVSQSFNVKAVKTTSDEEDDLDEDGTYRAPRSDMLFAVKKMYVWPSAFELTFKRNPQAARYEQVKNVQSAKIVVYFMKKLNFTIDRARMKFAGFSCNNVKGPPDRIIQSVKTFYLGQAKKKVFTLLTSTSIDEWRVLSGRDDGRDSYVEGDLLRTAGNLTGRSAGFLVKKVGQGIGQGLAMGTSELGQGIQSATEAVGVGVVGKGVNSLVSGIGEGVGSTVEGVGSGGNKIIKGAGKGVGQIVGGVGGGLQQVALGIGKGVATGDGNAILTGIGDGVTSIGTGVVKGTESVITGAAEGVFSVGKGLFKGVTKIGKGVGNAVQGKQPSKNSNISKSSQAPRRRRQM